MVDNNLDNHIIVVKLINTYLKTISNISNCILHYILGVLFDTSRKQWGATICVYAAPSGVHICVTICFFTL